MRASTRSVLTIAGVVARAAAGRAGPRSLVLAIAVMVGLGGCALSHGRAPSGRVEADAGPIVESDAGPLVPPVVAVDAGSPVPPVVAVDAAVPDGGADPDLDGDGYPASVDCDDANAAIHPGASEDPCWLDGVDQNCDGWDLDEECESDPECLLWLCNG